MLIRIKFWQGWKIHSSSRVFPEKCNVTTFLYIVRVVFSSTRNFIGLLVQFIKDVLFANIYTAEAGISYIPLLPSIELERARSTVAPYAFSKTRTSLSVRNNAARTHRNTAIVQNNLLDFRQAAIHYSKYGTTRVSFANYIHSKPAENHVLFSNSCSGDRFLKHSAHF